MVSLVQEILNLLSILVIADALLSWIAPDNSRLPRSFTSAIADPLSAPVRAILKPEVTGGIDFSPIVVIIVLNSLSQAIARASGALP